MNGDTCTIPEEILIKFSAAIDEEKRQEKLARKREYMRKRKECPLYRERCRLKNYESFLRRKDTQKYKDSHRNSSKNYNKKRRQKLRETDPMKLKLIDYKGHQTQKTRLHQEGKRKPLEYLLNERLLSYSSEDISLLIKKCNKTLLDADDFGCIESTYRQKEHYPRITINGKTAYVGGIYLVNDNKYPSIENCSMSHLCHNKRCVNPNHLCWESKRKNSSRDFCEVNSCQHEPKCLRNNPNTEFRRQMAIRVD